jgi:phosphatidate cytidylyltransferase
MLKQRIITAIILIPIFVLLILKLTPPLFCILTGAVVLIGAWEWSGLMGIKTIHRKLIYPVLITVLLFGSLYLSIPTIMYVASAWWISTIFLIAAYPRVSLTWGKGWVVRALMGVMVLIPAWLAINYIRNANSGPYALLFLFILIWGADSAAYFTGKKWGKSKLAPLVSPGKSWQGVYGAMLTTLLIALIVLISLKVPYAIWPGAILLSIITVIFSIVGDLFESMLKRNEGIKDSGTILPGHGGVLDRIDSLTAAAPIFVAGAMLLGKFYH